MADLQYATKLSLSIKLHNTRDDPTPCCSTYEKRITSLACTGNGDHSAYCSRPLSVKQPFNAEQRDFAQVAKRQVWYRRVKFDNNQNETRNTVTYCTCTYETQKDSSGFFDSCKLHLGHHCRATFPRHLHDYLVKWVCVSLTP